MKKLKLFLLLAMFLCMGPFLKAQNFIYSYSTAGVFPGGQTEVVKIINTYDHGYITLSYGTNPMGYTVSMFSKFTKNGEHKFSVIMQLNVMPGQVSHVRALDISEEPATHDLAIGGYLLEQAGAINKAFLSVFTQSGTVLWERRWEGNPVKALTFSKSPVNPLLYQVATLSHEVNNSPPMPTGMPNMVVTVFPQGGGIPPASTSIIVRDFAQHEAIDIVNIPSRNSFGIVGNRIGGGGGPHIIVCEVSHNLITVNGKALIPSTAGVSTFATRMIFDDVISAGPHLYISGHRINSNTRPIVTKYSLVSATATTTCMNATLPVGTSLYATGLTAINRSGKQGIMVSCYSQSGAIIESEAYATNTALATQTYYRHLLTGRRYTDVANNPDVGMFMFSGRDVSTSLTLTRADYNAETCDNMPQQKTDESINVNYTTVDAFNPFTYTDFTLNLNLLPFNLSPTVNCGCEPGTGKAHYEKAINMGSYSFGSWKKNQADFNSVSQDVVMGITAIDAGTNKIMLGSVAVDGVWNFSKVYSTTNATHEVRSVKRLENGDYALAGVAKLNSGGRQQMFILRTDGDGDVLWYKRLNTTGICGCVTPVVCDISNFVFNHVYITETETTKDLVLAADFIWDEDESGDIAVARVSADGNTLKYYENHRPRKIANKNKLRYDLELNGITSTSDDGYAVCGSSGNNGEDWNGTLVVKFDAFWSGTHTRNWDKIFLDSLPDYDLGDTAKAVYAVATDIDEDASGNLVVVGYINNMNSDRMYENHTYGLLLLYNSSGVLLQNKKFISPTAELGFMGVTVTSSGDYAVTGKWGRLFGLYGTTGSPFHQSVFFRIPSSATSSSGRIYGTYSTTNKDELNCAFEQSTGDFTLTGLSDDFGGTVLPTIYSVEPTGEFECQYNSLGPGGYDMTRDQEVFNWSSYYDANLVNDNVSTTEVCLVLEDLCAGISMNSIETDGLGTASATAPASQTGIKEPQPAGQVIIYPNPSQNKVTVDMVCESDIKATIKIFDMQGRIVGSKDVSFIKGSNTAQLDINELNSGLYMIQIENNRQGIISTHKFQKL